MALDAATRRRFARQLLLGEIGDAGQERLLVARFRRGVGGDPEAYAVAAEYLERAGCSVGEAGDEVNLPAAISIDRMAGSPELRASAALIAGAFAATEHLKKVLGVGLPRELPVDLHLHDEV